jgi:hypothetical protein
LELEQEPGTQKRARRLNLPWLAWVHEEAAEEVDPDPFSARISMNTITQARAGPEEEAACEVPKVTCVSFAQAMEVRWEPRSLCSGIKISTTSVEQEQADVKAKETLSIQSFGN